MFQLSVKTKEVVGFETPDGMKVRAILADLSPQITTSYPLKNPLWPRYSCEGQSSLTNHR